ncbi:MAG: hypothetical protein IT195_14290 [Microthrixaceae bacterium]|nr:hypothetical protein [Microthrixaceae bacterium]
MNPPAPPALCRITSFPSEAAPQARSRWRGPLLRIAGLALLSLAAALVLPAAVPAWRLGVLAGDEDAAAASGPLTAAVAAATGARLEVITTSGGAAGERLQSLRAADCLLVLRGRGALPA